VRQGGALSVFGPCEPSCATALAGQCAWLHPCHPLCIRIRRACMQMVQVHDQLTSSPCPNACIQARAHSTTNARAGDTFARCGGRSPDEESRPHRRRHWAAGGDAAPGRARRGEHSACIVLMLTASSTKAKSVTRQATSRVRALMRAACTHHFIEGCSM